jgi:hypothetical protein
MYVYIYIYIHTHIHTHTHKQNTHAGFFHAAEAPSGSGLPHYRGYRIILRHTTVGRTHLDEWSARRKDLHLTAHKTHEEEMDNPCPGGIRTHNPIKRETADPRLSPRDHWVRHTSACVRACVCVCVYIYRHTQAHVNIHAHLDTHTYTTHTHTRARTRTHTKKYQTMRWNS